MAKAVFFDEKGRYKSYNGGVHSVDYFGRNDVALNPPGLKDLIDRNIPKKYWKKVIVALEYINGNPVMNDVEEIIQAEKDIVDAEIADKEAAEEEVKRNPDNLEKLIKCCFLAILQKMNYPIAGFKEDVENIYKSLE